MPARPLTASLLGSLLLALTAGLFGVATEWRRAEKKARDEAAAHHRADLAQEQARAELYLSNIAQARLEWRLNNVARAGQLLDHCEPRAPRLGVALSSRCQPARARQPFQSRAQHDLRRRL